MYLYIYTYLYISIHIYIYTCIYVFVHVYACREGGGTYIGISGLEFDSVLEERLAIEVVLQRVSCVPETSHTESNHIFHLLDLHPRSPESVGSWCKSKRLKKTI